MPLVKQAVWRTSESEKPAPRQSVRYFSSLFLCSGRLFFWWILMLWPYAEVYTTDLSVQTYPVSLPFLPHPPPTLRSTVTNRLLWDPSSAPTILVGLKHPPTPDQDSYLDTFYSHRPHTAPLCALNLPPPPLFPSLFGWSFVCWTGLPHLLYRLLISYSLWKSLHLLLPQINRKICYNNLKSWGSYQN